MDGCDWPCVLDLPLSLWVEFLPVGQTANVEFLSKNVLILYCQK